MHKKFFGELALEKDIEYAQYDGDIDNRCKDNHDLAAVSQQDCHNGDVENCRRVIAEIINSKNIKAHRRDGEGKPATVNKEGLVLHTSPIDQNK